jgi:predicted alpha/beta hydrolase family esterase
MTILILHGIGGRAGIHWEGWLAQELEKLGNRVIMPTLPAAERSDRKTWLNSVRKLVDDVDLSDLIIVGHSLGVVTALDLIEQTPVKALISVSGFVSDYGAEMNGYFLKEKTIDFDKVNKNLQKKFVIYGDNDPYVPQATLKSLADNLKINPEVIPNGGHLNTDAGYISFPRLLEIIRKEI